MKPIDYFRAGYKYYRSFDKKVIAYDEAAEQVMKKGFEDFLRSESTLDNSKEKKSVFDIPWPVAEGGKETVFCALCHEPVSRVAVLPNTQVVHFNCYHKKFLLNLSDQADSAEVAVRKLGPEYPSLYPQGDIRCLHCKLINPVGRATCINCQNKLI